MSEATGRSRNFAKAGREVAWTADSVVSADAVS
jgi:hypothetical protein